LTNFVELAVVLGIYGLEGVEKSAGLAIDIGGVCILEFCNGRFSYTKHLNV